MKIAVKALLVLIPGLFTYNLAAQPLRFDYSTYLGGSSFDYGDAVAVDSSARAVVVGYTNSDDFPSVNPYQSTRDGYDVFISKFSSSGSALVFSTYFGGSEYDKGKDVALDSAGTIWLTGSTESADFPTTLNAYQSTFAGGTDDTFMVRLSASGDTVYYSTYLGGQARDIAHGIAVDTIGQCYLTGSTGSDDFPTLNAYQPTLGGSRDAFVTCFSSLEGYSTYLGGNDFDIGYAIVVDSRGDAYVAGSTSSFNFPTLNPYQSTKTLTDGFAARLSSTGSYLVYSTYLGGNGYSDKVKGLGVDSAGSVYLTGYTNSSNFPTVNPYQAAFNPGTANDYDTFLSRLSSCGSSLLYSSYLGGGLRDWGNAVIISNDGPVYVAGKTYSLDFPTVNPYQGAYPGGAYSGFISGFSSSLTTLIYSSYLGGSGYEQVLSLAGGEEGAVYVTGETSSEDFPTVNPYQAAQEGFINTFVCRLVPEESERKGHTDFNGDGTSDIAIFRANTGLWAVRNLTRLYFGASTDQAVPADFDGNGTTEVAIFRGSSGLWAVRSLTRVYFGNVSDLPRPGDYNGDGSDDFGLFRGDSGLWAIRDLTRLYFGESGDVPAPGYYDGSGTMDPAIFRDSTGLWAIRGISRIYFGQTADTARPGDYEGDGQWGPAIFRPLTGLWAVRGLTRVYFGSSVDQPRPADYTGDAGDDIGIFRASSGLWAVRGVTRVYFGASGDDAVTR